MARLSAKTPFLHSDCEITDSTFGAYVGIADLLIALAWWDRPHDRLRHALADFRSLRTEAFFEKYEC